MSGLLVFGRTGQVARELQHLAPVLALGRDAADLAQPGACAAAIHAHRPRAVINAAAYTAVDRAEEEEDLAIAINGAAPAEIALACAALNIPLVHISTDYVFPGTGHAFIKQAMRDEDAVYGGEMSAHHYFHDFVYCDSGMIPWLLVAELVSRHGPLADLVADRKAAFPSSGEINFTLEDPTTAIARVRAAFEPEAISIDEMDGLGFDMSDWRFNLRSSNTEPVVRLNVEVHGDAGLVAQGVQRVKRALLG